MKLKDWRRMSMTSGEKIKKLRKEAGFTQEQLAERLSVSRQAVTKWETDKGIPDIENIKALSDIMNVSFDYLLKDEMEVQPENESNYDSNTVQHGLVTKKLKLTYMLIGAAVAVIIIVGTIVVINRIIDSERTREKNTENTKVNIESITGEEYTNLTKDLIVLIEQNDYDILSKSMTADLKQILSADDIDAAKKQISEDFGERVSMGKAYITYGKQNNKNYTAVEMSVSYKNVSVGYTFVYDEEMKLTGLYMK